jgi:isoleucyl-tRNA synthetase
VRLAAAGAATGRLREYEPFLPTLFGVSQVVVEPAAPGAPGAPALSVVVERADGVKCGRCWRYVPEVSADDAFKGLCPRCVEALRANGLPEAVNR